MRNMTGKDFSNNGFVDWKKIGENSFYTLENNLMTIFSRYLQQIDYFYVVDKAPCNYFVWNIPEDCVPDGYLPLCRLSAYQPFVGARNIDVDALKMVKIDNEGKTLLMHIAGYGFNNLEKIEKELAKSSKGNDQMRIILKAALPYARSVWY